MKKFCFICNEFNRSVAKCKMGVHPTGNAYRLYCDDFRPKKQGIEKLYKREHEELETDEEKEIKCTWNIITEKINECIEAINDIKNRLEDK